MANIAVNTDVVNVDAFAPTPVLTNARLVRINGNGVVVAGDSVTSHVQGLTTHAGASVTNSQAFVRVNGQYVIINNDLTTCAHLVVGTGFVTING
jgi:uncharacterized Zn-binding protein involved in type VI secretion